MSNMSTTQLTTTGEGGEDLTSPPPDLHLTTNDLDPPHYVDNWESSPTADFFKAFSPALMKYGGAFVLVLGVVGNILCLVIFHRKKLRSVQVTIFLRVLSFVDLMLVLIGFGLYPNGPLEIKVVETSKIVCKLYFFFLAVVRSMSIWLVVGFNLERCLAIASPLKLKSQQALKSRVIYICMVVFVLVRVGYDTNILILFDLVPKKYAVDTYNCEPLYEKNPVFVTYVRPWLSLSLNTFLPFIIILICNIRIMVELRRSSKFQGKGSEKKKKKKRNSHSKAGATSSQDKGEKLHSIAPMLLAVSLVFLVLNAPLGVAMFLRRIFPDSYWWGTADRVALSNFMWTVAVLTMYLNSSINFILYMLSGRTFRIEVWRLFEELWVMCSKGRTGAGKEDGVSSLNREDGSKAETSTSAIN